jgi:hypothetical protein
MARDTRHLAQFNIARLKHPLDDPRLADFVANLDRVNAVAERSQGFVWRLKDDSGNSTGIKAYKDPLVLINMSVWESAEALERYVWQTVHKRVYGRRQEWFEPMEGPHIAMWWIAVGEHPGAEEGRRRLEHLAAHGPSEHAFGWESVPSAQLWKAARCA